MTLIDDHCIHRIDLLRQCNIVDFRYEKIEEEVEMNKPLMATITIVGGSDTEDIID